jgi:hypothetical protein
MTSRSAAAPSFETHALRACPQDEADDPNDALLASVIAGAGRQPFVKAMAHAPRVLNRACVLFSTLFPARR